MAAVASAWSRGGSILARPDLTLAARARILAALAIITLRIRGANAGRGISASGRRRGAAAKGSPAGGGKPGAAGSGAEPGGRSPCSGEGRQTVRLGLLSSLIAGPVSHT